MIAIAMLGYFQTCELSLTEYAGSQLTVSATHACTSGDMPDNFNRRIEWVRLFRQRHVQHCCCAVYMQFCLAGMLDASCESAESHSDATTKFQINLGISDE